MRKMPLLVHIVFHPDSKEAREIALAIHYALNHDSLVPGLDIPTVFCNVSENSPPADQGLDRAERNFVVLLACDYLVAGENAEAWHQFAVQTWRECKEATCRFVPIQLSKNAWSFSTELKDACVSFGHCYDEDNLGRKKERVCKVVAIELARFLMHERIGKGETTAPFEVFISHAKCDIETEPQVTRELIKLLSGVEKPVAGWMDTGAIAPGENFATKIEDGINRTSFLAVLTDNYATREWCRTEVLLAKEKQRPMLVIDALRDHEVRSFPYLGNVPVVRWNPKAPDRPIHLLIKESVRQLHVQMVLDQRKEPEDQIAVRPPELATIAGTGGKKILYPDPPLGNEELRLLYRLNIQAETPLQRIAKQKSLGGKKIALSMSESSDIQQYGFDECHIENAIVELSRYILIQGARLVYGGDLGKRRYTDLLFELVRTHNRMGRTGTLNPIINYSGWPLPKPTVQQQADFFGVGEFVRIDRPDSLNESDNADFQIDPTFFPDTKSALHRFAWSLGMTKMRTQQASDTLARVVLGGKTGLTITKHADGTIKEVWYKGRIPGVLEEVYLSAKQNRPVFLIGAFGGAAAMIIDLIEGKQRPEATWDYQKQAPHSESLKEIYSKRGVEWESYDTMIGFLRQKGVAGINPLLTEQENRELFRTVDLVRITEMVISGLAKLA
jgi:hypothetical protein